MADYVTLEDGRIRCKVSGCVIDDTPVARLQHEAGLAEKHKSMAAKGPSREPIVLVSEQAKVMDKQNALLQRALDKIEELEAKLNNAPKEN